MLKTVLNVLGKSKTVLWSSFVSEIVDCLVSIDGTWQKWGHQSLLGAVYVIEYRTGKVLDYNIVFCKCCHNCNLH